MNAHTQQTYVVGTYPFSQHFFEVLKTFFPHPQGEDFLNYDKRIWDIYYEIVNQLLLIMDNNTGQFPRRLAMEFPTLQYFLSGDDRYRPTDLELFKTACREYGWIFGNEVFRHVPIGPNEDFLFEQLTPTYVMVSTFRKD